MAGPVMLIIRDGWGINPGGPEKREENGNATLLASTPFHDCLYHDYPWSRLSASGMDVGLPEGQMGNSEVGHLNLGAGRIVYQDLTRINKAIGDSELERTDCREWCVPDHHRHVCLSGSRVRAEGHASCQERWNMHKSFRTVRVD